MNNLFIAISSISLYLISTVLFMLRYRQVEVIRHFHISVIVLPGVLGLLAHIWLLESEMLSPIGINLGFFNALSLITACITLFTLVATLRHPTELLCIIMMPIAAATITLDISITSSHVLAPGSSNALIVHVLTSLIAYSVLGLAALHAIMLSIQNSNLHSHQPYGILKLLPPLKTMESLLFEAISIGFILLSISLITGLLFLDNMFAQHLVHKTVLSIIAWLVFAILLGGRYFIGWRGKQAIRWTLGGFISLMLAYFGSKFVLEVILAGH